MNCVPIPALLLAVAIGAGHTARAAGPTGAVAAQPNTPLNVRRGWHFYEDPQQEAPPPPAKPPAAQPPAADGAAELKMFKQLQKDLEDLRAIAIINPTDANVLRYMELEAKVLKGASNFADVAQRIAWRTPGLDPTAEGRPVNSSAIDVYDQLQAKQRDATLARLSKDHVLMFFFRSDCPYCHAFAPVLKKIEAVYGLQVHAVSLDGGPIPGFAAYRRDNGIARTLNVTQVPAVFLAQPFTGDITLLGLGVLSESQLAERIIATAQPNDVTPVSWTAR